MADRLFVVMTKSPCSSDGRVLARVRTDRAVSNREWWTDRPEDAWLVDRETADSIAAKLEHNNPQVLRAEKALKKLEAQAADRARKEGTSAVWEME